jgi:hypothetical protein
MSRRKLAGLVLVGLVTVPLLGATGCPNTAEPTKGDVPQNPNIFPPPDSTPPPTPRPAALEVSR